MFSDNSKVRKTFAELKKVPSEDDEKIMKPIHLKLGRGLQFQHHPALKGWQNETESQPVKLEEMKEEIRGECRALRTEYQDLVDTVDHLRAHVLGQIDYFDRLHAFAAQFPETLPRPVAADKYDEFRMPDSDMARVPESMMKITLA
ncbi:hypothetical protein J8273_2600 [Carpediemonas membranifera]|uniref:Uncharacterized protein n=1 Tax=Carpediemonas membranifera TaxID=201153 RepID=A0A8J6E3Q6_9EUKA|nr:hypothetical protein J8273_2600 [Carpediemonas membranifera]|eukprot:KAG9396248.1 hypothetical protein J8273_2600 [Carpediemonas membranifera]